MTASLVPSRFVLRHDTAANWTAVNPILALGEEGYETDTGKRKIGDGTTHWTSLAYMAGGGGSSPDASPTVKGLVQLTGDFGGTAGSPTVPGLATKAQRLTRTSVKTSDYTASAGDLVPVDTGTPAANVTITLPNAPASGTRVGVKHVNAGPNKAVAIACAGSDVFNVTGGVTGVSLTVLNQAVLLQYDSGIWTVVSDSLPKTSLDAVYGTLVTPDADTATTGTLQANKHHYVSAAGGNVSRALPTGQPLGTQILLEKSDSGTNTVSATGSIRGVGSSTFTLTLAHESVLFVADSSGSWWPFVGHKTLSSLDSRFAPITGSGAYQTVVNHGSTAGTARPSGAVQVLWIGSVAPTNGATNDEWLDTSVSPYNLWAYTGSAWGLLSGSGELGYAENVTGTNQTGIVNVATDVTSCSVAVPASTRPIYGSAMVTVYCTSGASTTAVANLKIVEVSNGVDTVITSPIVELPLPNTSTDTTLVIPAVRLLTSSVRTRTFKLMVSTNVSSVTINIRNGQFGARSTLAVEAR